MMNDRQVRSGSSTRRRVGRGRCAPRSHLQLARRKCRRLGLASVSPPPARAAKCGTRLRRPAVVTLTLVWACTTRQFGGSRIVCELFDGVTDYRRKPPVSTLPGDEAAGGPAEGAESVVQQEKQLDQFADWLEADSTDEELETADDD